MRGLVKGNPRSFQSNFVGSITNYAIDTGVKGRVIPFVFSPTGLTDSVSANFNQTTIPGGSAPQITYTNTGARQVSFSLELPLDYLPPNSAYTDFEDYLNAFRALVYPKYTSGGGRVQSPHCKLVTSNIEIDGVCTNCSIEYKTDRYALDGSMSATVSLSFLEVIDNVGAVDAKWIANSKVKVLGKTNMSVGTTSSGNINSSNGGSISTDTSRCYVSITGPRNQTIELPVGDGIKAAIEKGIWKDQGCTITNAGKYSIKRLYGFTGESTASVSGIIVSNSGSHTCICNGRKINLQAGPFNTSELPYVGQICTYFVIYIPMYDGNKYEVDSAEVRYINVKVVE